MKCVIACDTKDIPKVKKIYRFMTRVKGSFPTIFDAYLIHNKYMENKNKYPKNFVNKVSKYLQDYDIVIVPLKEQIVTEIYSDDRIDNFYIYEK